MFFSNSMLMKLAAAAVLPLNMSFVAATNSAAPAITISASAAAGDLAILLQGGFSTTAVTRVTPSGWTAAPVSTGGTSAPFTYLYTMEYRILTSGQPGTSVTGTDAAQDYKIMMIFRPDRPITAVSVVDVQGQFTTGTPTTQTIPGNTRSPSFIMIGNLTSGNNGIVKSGTIANSVAGNTTGNVGAYEIFNSSPASRTLGMNDPGTNIMQSAIFLLS